MTIAFSGCGGGAKSVKDWTDAEVNSWFEKQEWLNGWQVKPDNSIDKRLLAESYSEFKDRWDMAFQFLKSTNLQELSRRVDVDGNNVYVLVSTYDSKDKNEVRNEVHKRYVDIQYVAIGEEYMSKMSLSQVGEATTPYSEANDIEYFGYEEGPYFLANQGTFFIFFPDEVHRSQMKINESIPMKRIVVKILVE